MLTVEPEIFAPHPQLGSGGPKVHTKEEKRMKEAAPSKTNDPK